MNQELWHQSEDYDNKVNKAQDKTAADQVDTEKEEEDTNEEDANGEGGTTEKAEVVAVLVEEVSSLTLALNVSIDKNKTLHQQLQAWQEEAEKKGKNEQ